MHVRTARRGTPELGLNKRSKLPDVGGGLSSHRNEYAAPPATAPRHQSSLLDKPTDTLAEVALWIYGGVVSRVLALGIKDARTCIPSRSVQWAGFGTGIALLAVLWLTPWVGFIPPVHAVYPDQQVYEETLQLMHRGNGYYAAASLALAKVYHPPARVEEIRTPVVFWIWSVTGISWPVAFIVIVLVGLLVGYLSWPLAGLSVAGWLMLTARPPSGVAEWAWNEIWALVPVLVSLLLIRQRRWGWAALAALLAACIRETAVPVVIGGLVGAFAKRETWRPWAAALAAWVAFMSWHVHEVWPYLISNGVPMRFGGGWRYALDMTGADIGVVGVAVVFAALWRSRRSFDWFFGGPLLMLPLVGLFYYRGYWSWLVLPVAVAMLGARHEGSDAVSGSESSSAIVVLPEAGEDIVVVPPTHAENELEASTGTRR